MEWLIPAIGLGLSIFKTGFGIYGAGKAKTEARRAQRRDIFYALEARAASEKANLERLKEMTALNESRLKLFEGAQFQRGSYTGPYFQMVK